VNEVWFDNVRVPGANMVGDPRKGWDYAKFLLSNERIGIARLGFTKERLRRIRALAASETEHGRPLLEDRGFRERLAALEVELKALELTQLRVLANDAKHGPQGRPDPASSILKLKGSELQQAATELLMELAAPYGMPDMTRLAGSNDLPDIPDWAGTATPHYLNWRKVSIYGGSSEIQKNIVAKAVLGL
jgi:alkylation response protein AidB-like acyl-CoA dehydrogenase